MGYQLQVQGRAPHFLSEVNPALGDIVAAIAIEGGNKQAA